MKRKRGWLPTCVIVLVIGGFLLALTRPAEAAEKFPGKTVTLVVSHAAGGTTDLPARLVQPFLERELGVPVVVTNKTGAGGNIARSYVWKINPDGYNLLVTQEPSMSSGAIATGGDFDPLGFVPVYNISGKQYMGLAVHYDSPFKNIREFIEAAKKKELTLCGSGVGTISWLTYVLMTDRHGGKFQYVPFNSVTEALMAVAGGQVEATTGTYLFMPALEEQKKIRMLALLSEERAEYAPNTPTAKEQGIEGISLDQITAVYGPPGLSQDKVKILADAFERATKDPEFHKKAKEAKCTLDLMGPAKMREATKRINDAVQSVRPQIEAIKGQMK